MNRRLLLGAVLAGAASAVRVTALATGVAYALALVAITISEWPLDRRALVRRALEIALAAYQSALLGQPVPLEMDTP